METEQLLSIFKKIDSGTWLELLLIALTAAALIMLVQIVLPWFANCLRGRIRFWLLTMVPLLRLLLIVGAFLLMVPKLIEPSLQNMVAIMGSLGLALGFALKDYVASLIAGVLVVSERPYRTGDWIEYDGHYGEVRHIGIRTVQIHTSDDSIIFVPHLKMWQESVSNANNGTPSLQCVTRFYLTGDHDVGKARALLCDVALTSPYLRYDRPVSVVINEQPWGVYYQLKAYPVDPRQQFQFISDLTERGRKALAENKFNHPAVPVALKLEQKTL